ncbi:MAG: mechanosensitive ion channel family protein [Candidatus Sumerlaeia bacterium]|nr:mechanosensitive ion channel family protein [Candidatus Sumerlaeia bacterium]
MDSLDFGQTAQQWVDRVLLTAPTVLATLFVFVVAYLALNTLMRKVEALLVTHFERNGDKTAEMKKRAETLTKVLRKVVVMVLYVVAILTLLDQFGVSIAPLLASASIVGLAVGFGAQNLARDFISGVFILIENQIRVGDVAVVNGTGGLVEDINLRTTILRDIEGTVHIFPNGTITTIANRTKDWSAFVIDMGVAYKEDPDRVLSVMKGVCDEMRGDEKFGPQIINDIEVFGLDNFGDSALVFKARIKTTPGQQWAVGREYRRRLKYALDKAGMEIPFPHLSLYFGEASKPFELASKGAS